MFASNVISIWSQGDVKVISNWFKSDLNILFQWYLNGVEVIGETGQTFDATQAGTYTVEALNCICRTMSSQSQTLHVNPLPTTPLITQNGSSLQIEPTNSEIYWYKNGNLVASNTTVIDNIQDGLYTVMLKNDCGDKMSEAVQITTSGI